MTAETILWVALLVIMAALFFLFTRRASVLIARTRDLERVQHAVESIDLRLHAATMPIVTRLDEIRRHAGDPRTLAGEVEPTVAMLQELAAETRALRVPAVLAAQAAVMVHETERAVRAAELVGHGLDALLVARGVRELEAQTSLKRGALNLRHAREAFGRAAAEVAAMRPAEIIDRPAARARILPPPVVTPPVEVAQPDHEGPFEPRM